MMSSASLIRSAKLSLALVTALLVLVSRLRAFLAGLGSLLAGLRAFLAGLSLGFLLVRVLASLGFLAGLLLGLLVLLLSTRSNLSLGGRLLHLHWWCLFLLIILLIVLIIILSNCENRHSVKVDRRAYIVLENDII